MLFNRRDNFMMKQKLFHDSLVRTQETPPFLRKKKKRSNSEINVSDIREMFHRQAENGQRNEQKTATKLLYLISLCVTENKFPKDTLFYCYSVPHLEILFTNWVITTLRVIIFAGTKFHPMFICYIKFPRKCRGKKIQSSSKKLVIFFCFSEN